MDKAARWERNRPVSVPEYFQISIEKLTEGPVGLGTRLLNLETKGFIQLNPLFVKLRFTLKRNPLNYLTESRHTHPSNQRCGATTEARSSPGRPNSTCNLTNGPDARS